MDSEKTDKSQTNILLFRCITSHMADITSRMTDICRKHPSVSNEITRGKGNLWIQGFMFIQFTMHSNPISLRSEDHTPIAHSSIGQAEHIFLQKCKSYSK